MGRDFFFLVGEGYGKEQHIFDGVGRNKGQNWMKCPKKL